MKNPFNISDANKTPAIALGLGLLMVGSIPLMLWLEGYKQAHREIAEIQSLIDAGQYEDINRYAYDTEAGRAFAEEALDDYAEIKEAYPAPIITILNEYQIEEETYQMVDGPWTITNFIINTGDMNEEYLLKFRVDDAERIWIDNGSVKPSQEQEVALNEEGIYEVIVALNDPKNNIWVYAENQYEKEASESLVISREENSEERDMRIKIAQNETEWEQSEAGQLCAKYPEWSTENCKKVADGKVWIGMTYDMLIEERGKPSTASPSNYGYGVQWQWCWSGWTPFCFYDDNDDGIIDSYN